MAALQKADKEESRQKRQAGVTVHMMEGLQPQGFGDHEFEASLDYKYKDKKKKKYSSHSHNYRGKLISYSKAGSSQLTLNDESRHSSLRLK